MPPLDFPSNPTNGQTYENYQYDSSITAWRNFGTPNALGAQVVALQTANATTNRSGLVPVIPTSIAVGSGTGTVDSSGLVSINGATSVNLNGVFTDTYKRYKIVIGGYSSSSEWLNIRYITGITVNQSSNYYFAGGYVNTSGMAFQGASTNGTYGRFGYAASDGFIVDADIVGVRETDRYTRSSNRLGYGTIAETMYGNAYIVNSTTFDGIQIFHATGANLNMTVKVYGYN